MKLILEFQSMAEMLAFCRKQVIPEGDAPHYVPANGSSGVLGSERLGNGILSDPEEDQEPLAGLGKRQMAVLRALSDGEHRSTKWISEQIGLAVPALSTCLTSLAKRDLVTKVKWGTWASAAILEETSAGEAPVAAAPPVVAAPVEAP